MYKKIFKLLKNKISYPFHLYKLIYYGDPERIKYSNSEYFILSHPKSGRTWLRVMLSKYLSSLNNHKFSNLIEIHQLTTEIDAPIISFNHDNTSYNYGISMNKTHFKNKKYKNETDNVILLVRDPRDVIVSYYLHCTRRRKYFSGTISDFIRDDKFGIEKIIMFLNNWVKNSTIPKNFF